MTIILLKTKWLNSSALRAKEDENGVKHMLLCRVILGNTETIRAGKPNSPIIRFSILLNALSKFLHPSKTGLVLKWYNDFRKHKIDRSELIRRMRSFAGDEVLISAVKLCRDELEEMLERQGTKIDKICQLLEERITGRRIHPSGRTYHTKFAPPKVVGLDDVMGEPLIQRKDDTREVLKQRLKTFHQHTKLVIDYYSKKGVVAHIRADKPTQEVTEMIHKVVSA
ncbi:adenylate kinase 4 [Phtheirospermum japonicum]|uniref:adenylate kinase n=1 Tax=Phtheirospermum japonicum TaxID=374723 RepID=A0A830CUZ2_9LAMI|nr:adenylate kinase 4 [Phtheirospermum japonicum]